MADRRERWWQDREELRRAVEEHGTLAEVARVRGGVAHQTLSVWWKKHGLPQLPTGYPIKRIADEHDDGWLVDLLRKAGDRATVTDLANMGDVSPKRVKDALERLAEKGYRVGAIEHEVVLERVPPTSEKSVVHQALFEGDHVRIGVVSDTHLGANEEALEELHLAYDIFAEQGITQVWHAGDWGTGLELFKTHHSEAKVHTLDEQVEYLIKNYPHREGIKTRGISGNHDITGLAGRAGFDPIVPFAAARDDIEYLGIYDAWLETRPNSGRWFHLLHGSGGMSYSWSYKAQRLVDSYLPARKPGALIVGHWHVKGNIRARDVEVLWPGCFEWQSYFMKRLGLQPAVGFHILEMTIADDGSIVRWRPEWWPYFPGRKVRG